MIVLFYLRYFVLLRFQTIEDDATYDREISSFQTIKGNYRKILLIEDKGQYNSGGIELLKVID